MAISNDSKHAIKKEISEIDRQLDSLNKDMEPFIRQRDEIVKKINDYQSTKDSLKQKKQNLLADIKEV